MLLKRLWAFFSLTSFSVLVLGYLWWGKFQYRHDTFLFLAYVGAFVIVVANHVYYRDTAHRLGLRFDHFRKAALWYGGGTLACVVIIAAVGWFKGTPRLDRWSDLYAYFLWAGVQQHILQNFLRLRGEALFGQESISTVRGSLGPALLAASLFALYHLPNYPLVTLAFLGGLLWCLLFARIPSLFWAWVSHASVAVVLLVFFKYGLVDQFQVGSPGYRYEFYGTGVKVAAGYDVNNQAIIATLPGPDQGTTALLRVFSCEGRKLAEWEVFETLGFSGEIAVGDLGFGSGDEVAVAPGPGPNNPPLIRIFDLRGNPLGQFQPQCLDSGYGAWISISCGRLYVCPGPGPNRPQKVFEFSPHGELLNQWEFRDLGFVNGMRAAGLCGSEFLGDSLFPHGNADTRRNSLLLWATDISVNPSRMFLYDTVRDSHASFETLGTVFGVNAALVRLAENRLGVGVAPGPLQGYPPLIRVFDLAGKKLSDFFAFEDAGSCGSNIAAVDIDGDEQDELVLGEGVGPQRPSLVRTYRLNGRLLARWRAYGE